MADIELVIKIPEEIYIASQILDAKYKDIVRIPLEVIANSTPLPKGHKRLIAEPTEEDIAKTVGGQNDFAECIRDAVRMVYVNASTIVKADKE